MRPLKWYVIRINGYLYRVKCDPWYMDKLLENNAIDEYRVCKNKKEAIELCKIHNQKRRTKQ